MGQPDFSEYTEGARRAISRAQKEALRQGQKSSAARRALSILGIEAGAVCQTLHRIEAPAAGASNYMLGRRRQATVTPLPDGTATTFGSDSNRVFARAAELAEADGASFVGTEHLLLGLYDDPIAPLVRVILQDFGVKDGAESSGHARRGARRSGQQPSNPRYLVRRRLVVGMHRSAHCALRLILDESSITVYMPFKLRISVKIKLSMSDDKKLSLGQALANVTHVTIIQAENPDGDSLGSCLALEEILGDLGKKISMFCPVAIPKYLRYALGWDRISDEFDFASELVIVVDTASRTLLEKALTPEIMAHLKKRPVYVIDHHETLSDLPFEHEIISQPKAVATSEIIYGIAVENGWAINPQAAEQLLIALLSDSLGLTSEGTTSDAVRIVADLLDKGASIASLEARRREFMKKSPEILGYKGVLLQRVEYHLDGRLAVVHVTWDEIEKYSDKYNPGALVIDEMRLVEGVKVAVVIKTYPDGRLTGKIRVNPEAKVAANLAGYFGGGGHAYAAGFRVYETYEKIMPELIAAADKVLTEYQNDNPV